MLKRVVIRNWYENPELLIYCHKVINKKTVNEKITIWYHYHDFNKFFLIKYWIICIFQICQIKLPKKAKDTDSGSYEYYGCPFKSLEERKLKKVTWKFHLFFSPYVKIYLILRKYFHHDQKENLNKNLLELKWVK